MCFIPVNFLSISAKKIVYYPKYVVLDEKCNHTCNKIGTHVSMLLTMVPSLV
ncbi:hypothetical protein SLEP1_g12656 [Rubroshorea leprosula]|uniref:Uncharacterized protein n=1 Tax=Rubroshorea leprosula TaxID=152421 RepID=A0AAV5IME6_9ROSI|nr:hypothetical protein SLEP1_g12656 [Rubroshorea leprosula]